MLRKRLFLLCLFPLSCLASVTEELIYRYYTVHANSSTGLLAAINRASTIQQNGRVFHGYTKWYVSWRFNWIARSDGSCKIADSRVSVNATITLPRLASTPSAAVSSRFDTYLSNLKTHENGHYKIAHNAARIIDNRILSLPSMRNCAELENAVNRAGHEVLEQHRDKERQYDIRTQHGATQGAVLH